MLVLGLALIGGGIGVLTYLRRELGGFRPLLAAAVRRERPRRTRDGRRTRPPAGRATSPAAPRALGRATVPHQPPPQSDE